MSRAAGAVLFAAVFPSLMAWLYFVAAAGPAVPGTPPTHNLLAIGLFALAKALQFAFPVVWTGLVERQRLRPRPLGSAGLAWGLAFGLLVAVGGWMALQWVLRNGTSFPLEAIAGRVRGKMAEFGLLSAPAFLAFAAFLSVLHSFLEEYYWRWFVFGRLATMMPLGPATAASSLAFAAHHLIDLAVFFPGQFWTIALPLTGCVAMGGAFWAWLYARSGSLVAPWLSHALIDAAIMAAAYDVIFVYRGA